MANPIYNTEEIIDSRDVIARIDELQEDVSMLEDEIEELESDLSLLDDDEQEECDEIELRIGDLRNEIDEIKEELDPLVELADNAKYYCSDWTSGAALIHEDYFVEYAQELAEDIGVIQPDMDWPFMFIDWDAAADALKMDYSSVNFDGETYWVR